MYEKHAPKQAVYDITAIEEEILSDLAAITYATGDLLYFNGTDIVNLGIGSEGQVLKVTGGIPDWEDSGNLLVTGTVAGATLTSGRVPFATTAGLLTDSAALTFNSDTGTLTATYFVGDGSGLENVGATAATALSFNCAVSEAVKKGQAVYVVGGASALPNIAKADNTNTAKSRVVGIAVADANSGTVLVRRGGTLTNVDTRPANTNLNPNGETWLEGDLLFATMGGGLTKTRPTSGRSVKVAYSLKGSGATDTLLVYPMENPVWVTAAGAEDIVLRTGDAVGVNKVSLRDYANVEVGYFNSDGGGSLTGLALGAGNLTLTGSIGATGARSLKGWFADLEVTNAIAGSVTGNAGTVTNATFTTALTNNGGAGTLAWPAAGATLTIPTGGGTLGTAAFTASTAYKAAGTEPVTTGGTGLTTIADGSILAANAADTLSAITWHSAGTKVLTNTSGTISWENAAASGATTALDNLASVAINTSLISDTNDTDDLGSTDKHWHNSYVSHGNFDDITATAESFYIYAKDDGGYFNFSASDASTLNKAGGGFNLFSGHGNGSGKGGTVSVQAGHGGTTGSGGDTKIYAGDSGSGVSNAGNLEFYLYNGTSGGSNGLFKVFPAGDSVAAILNFDSVVTADKTFTFPNASGTLALTSDIPTDFAVEALNNLASVAINTTLVSDTDNTDALGTAAVGWSDLFLGNGSVITWSSAPSTADMTLTHSANLLSLTGGTFDVSNFSMTQADNVGGVYLQTRVGSSLGCYWNYYGAYNGAGGEQRTISLKSRGTIASPSVVSDGDIIANFYFDGYDGDEYAHGANFGAMINGTPGNDDMPMMLYFSTSPEGTKSPVERFRIEQDGGIFFFNLASAAASTNVNVNASGELHKVTSSARFKDNIRTAKTDTSKIYDLKLKNWEWKKDKTVVEESRGVTDFGLIAEEVATIFPELVNYEPDFSYRKVTIDDGSTSVERYATSEPKPYSIKTSELPMVLLAEMQKLNNRIKVLEAKCK